MVKKSGPPLSQQLVPSSLKDRVRYPFAVILGSPAEVVNLLKQCEKGETVCYQMDMHQADRLRCALVNDGINATVECLPDLWDLPGKFTSAVFLPAKGGERELKIDMVEQAFHILSPGGQLQVWSGIAHDIFFPDLMQKVFKKAHIHKEVASTVLWSPKNTAHERRRHEVTFQCRVKRGEPMRFLSRPGTFSYGQFDKGSRALCEVMSLRPGQKVIDIGCGGGINGCFAWQKVGPNGHVTFVDSNVRAVELARHNAQQNGVTNFTAVARCSLEGLLPRSFDIALANPPYFANHAIGRLFIEKARELIKADGSLFLVTKQPNEMVELMAEVGFEVEGAENRGYTVLMHRGPAARQDMESAQ